MSSEPAMKTPLQRGDPAERPFFLVGSERSGTTLLRLMLSHHPELECAPEFEFLVDRISPTGEWPRLEEYYDDLSVNRVFQPHELQIDPGLTYPELAQSFVRQYGDRSGKSIYGATCHHAFAHLPRVFPNGRFVHLLRDGRDVARSCIGMGWVGHVYYGVERWVDAMDQWELLKRIVPAERRLEIRYEDLIRNSRNVLEQVCAFLGTAFDERIFEYAENSTYTRPDPSLTQQWRRKLTPDELGLLEGRIGELLRERGYEESGVAAVIPGPWKRFRLFLANKRGFWRFRLERYGAFLLFKNKLARTFGLRGMERRVIQEMNAIENRHLK